MKTSKLKIAFVAGSVAVALIGLGSIAKARPIEAAETIQNTDAASAGWRRTWQQWTTETKSAANNWVATIHQKWDSLTNDVTTSNSQPQQAARSTASVNEGPSAAAGGAANAAAAANSNATSAAAVTPGASSETPEQQTFSKLIDQTQQELKGKSAIEVSSPARQGTSVLPKTKSGVPVFALSHTVKEKGKHRRRTIEVSVKHIPKLDIGTEPRISANQFLPATQIVGFHRPKSVKELPSPKLISERETMKVIHEKLERVAKAKRPRRGDFRLGQMVTHERIQAVDLTMNINKPLEQLKPIQEFSQNQLTMLAAAILYQKHKCHIVSGLLSDLAAKPKYAEESNYYLGLCAHQMGFNSEAVVRLLDVIHNENPDYTPEAVAGLVENLPREYDSEVVPALDHMHNRKLIPAKAEDDLHFVKARWDHEQAHYAQAAEQAAMVSQKSPHYASAQYFRAIGLYGAKHLKEAEKTLTDLRDWMSKTGHEDKNIEALVAINLARMMFTQGNFKSAEEEYKKVPKDHPLWIEALIEQGWTQLNLKDDAGAIGNMYSLHSPYFKSVYMPESWVVRTIGYIDICQYGDAYRSLSLLEHTHRGWQSKIVSYMAAHHDPMAYYNTVKNYVRGKSDRDVDGLPYQVIREIARRRGFTNDQDAINNLEDEISQYDFIYGVIRKDQANLAFQINRTRGRLNKLRVSIAGVKVHPNNMQFLNEWLAESRNEQLLLSAQTYQAALYEKARRGFLNMKKVGIAHIERKKVGLVHDAGLQLIAHLKSINSQLNQIFAGDEFLRYEIYSGSGENIRYQVSGGATEETHRIPANVKPQKILHWDFDGEYWADEIGSYRSTLRNNCPKNARTSASLGGAASAANEN